MSRCAKCGKEIKDNAGFCKSCGTQAAQTGDPLADKKARVMTSEKSILKPALIAVAVVGIVIGVWIFQQSGNQGMGGNAVYASNRNAAARLAQAMPVMPENGEVRIPLASVSDGKAHFFSYTSGSAMITFFLMKAEDGMIRAAFDACLACNHAKLGYRQEGTMVVCNNCGMAFKPADIGRKSGGCSPIAVNSSADGRTILLKTSDLAKGAQYF